jgi:hypothetical protein
MPWRHSGRSASVYPSRPANARSHVVLIPGDRRAEPFDFVVARGSILTDL